MQYVVSTHSFLLLIDFDDNWRILDMRTLDTGTHYGIALLSDSPPHFLAKHNHSDITAYRANGESILQDQAIRQDGNDQIHQMAYARGGLYIANTAFNSVTFQTLDGKTRHEYNFFDQRTDVNHVNSVFPCDDLLLVMLHNREKNSEIFVMEHDLQKGFKPREVIRLPHTGCHNVFIDGQHLYYCASSQRRFVVVNHRKRGLARDILFGGHTKGLSVTDNHVVLGVSQHARREARLSTRGQLAVLDRRNHAILTMVDLNIAGNVGNVNEIRCLSAPELAHTGDRQIANGLRSFSLVKAPSAVERLMVGLGLARARPAARTAAAVTSEIAQGEEASPDAGAAGAQPWS